MAFTNTLPKNKNWEKSSSMKDREMKIRKLTAINKSKGVYSDIIVIEYLTQSWSYKNLSKMRLAGLYTLTQAYKG